MKNVEPIEQNIVLAAAIFMLTLFGVIGLSVRLFGIGLPTCVTDIKPFDRGDVIMHAPDRFEIHYVAKMWSFDPPDVTIPSGSTVDVYLSTPDVTHGFQIMKTNVNLMAVPGTVNYARVKFDKPGVYHVLCHEYCGTGHHNMATTIRVTDRALGGQWSGSQALAQSGHPGHRILQDRSCLACHTVDGRPSVGPSLKGLYGKQETLASGNIVNVDDAYLTQSIRSPMAQVVKNFPPAMPTLPVTDAELAQIIDYIKTLK